MKFHIFLLLVTFFAAPACTSTNGRATRGHFEAARTHAQRIEQQSNELDARATENNQSIRDTRAALQKANGATLSARELAAELKRQMKATLDQTDDPIQ